MKIFGWGKKKEPLPIQPAHHDKVIKTSEDAGPPSRSIRNVASSATWGSQWPSKETHESEALAKGMASSGVFSWEDRMQETLRFVFSHEQEGLLAIGTFALDQLAEMRPGFDINELKPPPPTPTTPATPAKLETPAIQATPATPATPALDQSFVSSSMPVSFRSSSNVTNFGNCCKTKELPVFGDHDALNSRVVLPDVEPSKVILPVHVLHHNRVCTRNLCRSFPDDDPPDEDLNYSPGICGLFESSWSSWRTLKLSEKEKRKKGLSAAGKRVGSGNHREQQLCDAIVQATGSSKKPDKSKGFSSQLGRRLWQPQECRTSATEMVQVPGVPCIANVELEVSQPWKSSKIASEGTGERKRLQSFKAGTWACAQNVKWIRTDSEFVVLEI